MQRSFRLAFLLFGLIWSTGCVTKEILVEPAEPDSRNDPPTTVGNGSTYSNVTGAWRIRSRSGFGNNHFDMAFSVDVSLTQTAGLAPGYSKDVYVVSGNFVNLTWIIQRKADGSAYVLPSSYGPVANGAINTGLGSHNIQFNLSSQNFFIRGVTPTFATMWGDASFTLDMTRLYGTPDGIVTLTGMWEATRK